MQANENGPRDPLLRIGVQPYLYAKPLYWNLRDLEPELEVVPATPRKLAAMIVAGDLDVALVPFLTALRNPALSVIPDLSISHKGGNGSVMVYSKTAPADVKTILVDRSAINGIALLRALFRIRWSMQPVEVLSSKPLTADYPFQETDYDAFLLIGDENLKMNGDFHAVLDLGEQWEQWTELCLTDAVWAVREGLEGPALDELFLQARVQGLGNLGHIARREAARIGVHEEKCLKLFKKTRYVYDDEIEEGLRRFHYYMNEMRICDPLIDVKFYRDDHIETRRFGREEKT